ncbi:cysteine dioxygenase family protein [Plantactinospora sp. KBS50]|uniref:cysteine dioxygenase n=1 Tax=Plantactinospora sp. KBS50 TaxID=2024580 RepID=UPI000BAACC3A|nr:cysteine dioxygenase family protein [Plantactinospora sp. KBS50]ASW55020.1 cysteine dioxygenase [Plantactinospora sp. KBS50]
MTVEQRILREEAGSDLLTLARRYAAGDWPCEARFDPARRWYARLGAADDHEAWLLTWLPGQRTDLHDHGGSAGAFTVVSGALTEETVVDGWLRPRVLPGGAGRSFGSRHVHRVGNRGTGPAVSVHVYRPALARMTRYELAAGRLRPVEVATAGVAW